ncbi:MULTISPECIES: hypothetical protein [unclassified Variovorax]|uniref:hypothetical protein n=1 Tax=unclassified Variovorax TaxID=663243 RepID=UPI003ECE4030
MSLSPAISATLGNLRYDTQAIVCSACLDLLPRGGSARLSLPASVRFEAAAGDEASLDLDGGEGVATVLKGSMRSVRRNVDSIEVELIDAGAALAAYRPACSFEKQSAAQIIRKLVGDMALSAGTMDVDLDLPAYIAHPGRNAAEHVAELAKLGGAFACAGSDGKLEVRALPEGPADAALRFGREITHYDVLGEAVAQGQSFAIGAGPAGSSSAPDAMRPTVGFLPSSAAAGGPGVIRLATPLLRTPKAASDASDALSRIAAARASRLIAHCFLLPALRPGQVIEVQDLPDDLSGGPWLITRVEHRVAHGAGSTRFEARSASAPSLLGALLGAIGSLL